jgi:hypothetical protein
MANDNLSFIGVGRFRGYWNVATNSGTLTSDGGYDASRSTGAPLLTTGSGEGATSSAGGFHTGSSHGGATLTASAGDYFQITDAGTSAVDGETSWYVNDYVVCKSGSSGEFKWIRLSYTDTVSSVIFGGINSSSLSDALLDHSGTANRQILTVRTVDGSSSFSGSNNLKFHNESNTMQLTGTLSVSGAIEATEFKTTIVSSSVIFQSGSTKFGDDSGDIHDFTGSVYMGHNLYVTGNIVSTAISSSGIIQNVGSISGSGDLAVTGAIHAANFYGDGSGLTGVVVSGSSRHYSTTGFETSGYLKVSGNANLAGTISGSSTLQAVGNATIGGTLNVTGNATFDEDIFVGDKIYKKGVTDTYIDFDDTIIRFAVDQDSLDSTEAWRNFALTSGSARLNYDKVGIATIINYSGSDAAHPALMVEADGNKAVGIGIRPSFSSRTGLTLDVSGSTAHGWQTSGTLDNHHFTGSVFVSSGMNISGTTTVATKVTGSSAELDFANGNLFLTGALSASVIYPKSRDGSISVRTGQGVTFHLQDVNDASEGNIYFLHNNDSYFFRAHSHQNSGRIEIGAPLSASYGLSSSAGTIVSVGSISSSGDLAVTGAIHANVFYGDGSGLSGVDSVSGSSRHYSTTGFETSGYLKVSGSSTLNAIAATTVSGSGIFRLGTSLSSSGDIAITGAMHANAYYGDGSNLSGVGSNPSGTVRHYSTTGFETSGYLKVSGSSTLGHTLPIADVTYDLGSAEKRWRNIYTGDLHLKNDRGDWTVIEEEDYLTITNNKNGKRYKLLMEELD